MNQNFDDNPCTGCSSKEDAIGTVTLRYITSTTGFAAQGLSRADPTSRGLLPYSWYRFLPYAARSATIIPFVRLFQIDVMSAGLPIVLENQHNTAPHSTAQDCSARVGL